MSQLAAASRPCLQLDPWRSLWSHYLYMTTTDFVSYNVIIWTEMDFAR